MSKEFQIVLAFIIGALACIGVFSIYSREKAMLNNQQAMASQMFTNQNAQQIVQAVNNLSQGHNAMLARMEKLEGRK